MGHLTNRETIDLIATARLRERAKKATHGPTARLLDTQPVVTINGMCEPLDCKWHDGDHTCSATGYSSTGGSWCCVRGGAPIHKDMPWLDDEEES